MGVVDDRINGDMEGLRTPLKNIACENCTNALVPTKWFERYTFGVCRAYDCKPHDVLWDGADCKKYNSGPPGWDPDEL